MVSQKRNKYTRKDDRLMWKYYVECLKRKDPLCEHPSLVFWTRFKEKYGWDRAVSGIESHFRKQLKEGVHLSGLSTKYLFPTMKKLKIQLNIMDYDELERKHNCVIKYDKNMVFEKAIRGDTVLSKLQLNNNNQDSRETPIYAEDPIFEEMSENEEENDTNYHPSHVQTSANQANSNKISSTTNLEQAAVTITANNSSNPSTSEMLTGNQIMAALTFNRPVNNQGIGLRNMLNKSKTSPTHMNTLEDQQKSPRKSAFLSSKPNQMNSPQKLLDQSTTSTTQSNQGIGLRRLFGRSMTSSPVKSSQQDSQIKLPSKSVSTSSVKQLNQSNLQIPIASRTRSMTSVAVNKPPFKAKRKASRNLNEIVDTIAANQNPNTASTSTKNQEKSIPDLSTIKKTFMDQIKRVLDGEINADKLDEHPLLTSQNVRGFESLLEQQKLFLTLLTSNDNQLRFFEKDYGSPTFKKRRPFPMPQIIKVESEEVIENESSGRYDYVGYALEDSNK